VPTHPYQLPDGTYIPSVSRIVGQLKAEFQDPQKVREKAAVAGTALHDLIERTMRGEVVWAEDVPSDLRTAWESFGGWAFSREPVGVTVPAGLACELPLTTIDVPGWAPALHYGGTLDLVAETGGRRFLVDFKTRSGRDGDLPLAQRWELCQVAAYCLLWRLHNLPPLDGACVVMLGRESAAYRETWLTPEAVACGEREFLALLAAHAEHKARQVIQRETRAIKGAA
jgi:hypothetical protein